MAIITASDQALIRRAYTLMTVRGADSLVSRESPQVVEELEILLGSLRDRGIFPAGADVEETIRVYCQEAVRREF